MIKYVPSFVTAAVLAVALPALAATVTIAQILSDPSAYDQTHVDVTGKVAYVEHLQRRVWRMQATYVTFALCSGQCIHVYAVGSPTIHEGQTITVHGIFAAIKHVNGYTIYNVIHADDGSLRS